MITATGVTTVRCPEPARAIGTLCSHHEAIMKPLDRLRILEIGQFCLFKRNLPEQTTLVFTGENLATVRNVDHVVFGLRMLPWLRRTLSSGEWDVVLCHNPVHPVWDVRHGVVRGVRFLARRLARVRTLGTHLLDTRIDCPLVMLDFNDEPGIPRHAFPWLERCTAYFKRELPGDVAKAFLNAAPEMRCHPTTLASDVLRRNLHKLMPISAAVSEGMASLAVASARTKTADVFFAGSINSSVRRRGLQILESLRAEGYRVDICTGGLPRDEYFARCAAAWLTWSPEGYGWECHRHYEASLCRSVPVMNYPGILRHRPLVHGVHGFFYPLEGDALREVIVTALSDKPRLETMADEACRHARAHHTHARIVEHILSSGRIAPSHLAG